MKKQTKIILSVLVVLIIGLFVTYKIISSPKNIFLKGINESLNVLEKNYDNLLNSEIMRLSEKNSISSDINITTNLELNEILLNEDISTLIDEINKLKVNVKTGYDIKNKEILYVFNMLSDEESIMNINLYGKDKIVYLGIKQLFEKYIEIPFEEYDALFENDSIKDLTYLKNIIKNGVISSFNNNDFNKTSDTISIDGTKVKTNKINYEVTEKGLGKIILKVLNDIYKDQKTIDLLSKYSKTDKEELKKQIKESIDEFKEEYKNLDTNKVLDFNIYSKGLTNEIVRYELLVENDDTNSSFTYSNLDNKKVISFKDSDEEIFKSVTTKNKDESKTVVNIDDIVINITGSETVDNLIYKYETEIEEIKISGELKLSNKEVSKNKEYKDDLSFSIKISTEGIEVGTFTINVDSNTYVGKDLEISKPENSIEYTELTEDDLNTIINNFKSLSFISELMNSI